MSQPIVAQNPAKHTPGPWSVFVHSVTGTVNVYAGERKTYIAYCNSLEFDNRINQANARLIAAAPTLLEELKDVISRFDYNPGHSDLDNEQPIHVPMSLGDYRRIRNFIYRTEGR